MSRTRRDAERNWASLTDRCLPISHEDSVWRFSCERPPDLPAQGWKIHVSATILSAVEVLESVGPVLTAASMYFKGLRDLTELQRLNCGLRYGFSQVGKAFTVYSSNESQFRDIAPQLHAATRHLPGPSVPYDVRFCEGSLIYYRYGSFSGDRIFTDDGKSTPDLRRPNAAIPPQVNDPFRATRSPTEAPSSAPLKSTFKAYEALTQRGKGGVYRALNLGSIPARHCVVKEGRRHGETDWDGRDGRWRIGHEGFVLQELCARGIPVPQVISFFEDGAHRYLALEFIEGVDLQTSLLKEEQLSLTARIILAEQVASVLAKIHGAGWAWRDCKPLNLMLCRNGQIRPLDFEGASPTSTPDASPWGTAGYVPPEWPSEASYANHVHQDLYALGVTLRQISTGVIPPAGVSSDSDENVERVPRGVSQLIESLQCVDPLRRPSARDVSRELKELIPPGELAQAWGDIEQFARTVAV